MNQVREYGQVPVPEEIRKRTDIFCMISTSIFAAIMFIISIATLNTDNLAKMTYPADGQGHLCGWDAPDYPLLYYTSFSDPVKRLCVKECPKEGDTELSCFGTKSLSCSKNDNPKYEVQIYDSQAEHNRVGLFCWPTDEQKKHQLLVKSGLNDKYQFLAFYDAMWNSLWLSALFGIIFIAVLQFFPLKVVPFSVVIGGIFFIILGLLTIILPSGFILFRIIIGGLMITLGVLCLYAMWNDEYRKAIVICSRLMECATEVLKYDYKLLFYIPVFILLFVGLVFLVAFQLLAVWSAGSLTFNPQKPFYDVVGFISNLFSFFVFIEFFWGMSFLKQAFNFCVSGYATNWYYFKENNADKIQLLKSPWFLLKFHWGSVAGGSLLLGVFYFVDFILDFFFSNDRDIKKKTIRKQNFQKDVIEYPEGEGYGNRVTSFFNLVRSESMGYINIIPIGYCNASRYSEYMAEESHFYDRSQTVNRLYRLSAHSLIIFIVTVISIGTMKGSSGQASIMGVIIIMIISLFTVTYFICFHGDIAEGLLISIFIEEKLAGVQEIKQPPEIVQKVYTDDRDGKFDENNSIREVLI